MSTRFEELRERIQALPERQRRSEQIGRLTRFLSEIKRATEEFRVHAATVAALRENFPGANFKQIDGAREQAKVLAVRLKTALASDPDAIETPQSENQLVRLKAQSVATKNAIREEWRTQLDQVVARYEKLILAAHKVNLEGARALVNAIARMREYAAELPGAKATAVRHDLNLLAQSVRDLKLEGKGGRFLEQVLESRGDPSALSDPEVRLFLDENNLWDEIVVSFR